MELPLLSERLLQLPKSLLIGFSFNECLVLGDLLLQSSHLFLIQLVVPLILELVKVGHLKVWNVLHPELDPSLVLLVHDLVDVSAGLEVLQDHMLFSDRVLGHDSLLQRCELLLIIVLPDFLAGKLEELEGDQRNVHEDVEQDEINHYLAEVHLGVDVLDPVGEPEDEVGDNDNKGLVENLQLVQGGVLEWPRVEDIHHIGHIIHDVDCQLEADEVLQVVGVHYEQEPP